MARSRSPAAAAAQASSSRAKASRVRRPAAASVAVRRPRSRPGPRRSCPAPAGLARGAHRAGTSSCNWPRQPLVHRGQGDPGRVDGQFAGRTRPGYGQRRDHSVRASVSASRTALSASSTASSAQPGRSCPNWSGRPRCRKDSSRARAGPPPALVRVDVGADPDRQRDPSAVGLFGLFQRRVQLGYGPVPVASDERDPAGGEAEIRVDPGRVALGAEAAGPVEGTLGRHRTGGGQLERDRQDQRATTGSGTRSTAGSSASRSRIRARARSGSPSRNARQSRRGHQADLGVHVTGGGEPGQQRVAAPRPEEARRPWSAARPGSPPARWAAGPGSPGTARVAAIAARAAGTSARLISERIRVSLQLGGHGRVGDGGDAGPDHRFGALGAAVPEQRHDVVEQHRLGHVRPADRGDVVEQIGGDLRGVAAGRSHRLVQRGPQRRVGIGTARPQQVVGHQGRTVAARAEQLRGPAGAGRGAGPRAARRRPPRGTGRG